MGNKLWTLCGKSCLKQDIFIEDLDKNIPKGLRKCKRCFI